MIVYSNRFLTYGITYYDDTYNIKEEKIDVLRLEQYSKKYFYSHFHTTLHINLSKNESEIFDSFEKNTKYEINRAKNKDNITIRTLKLPDEKQQFYDFYSVFSEQKKLLPLGTRETDLLIEDGKFVIRSASTSDGTLLVMHSYILSNNRARLAHSASLFRESEDNAFRTLTGRANRFLHWEDILYFREKGFTIYDLGGINTDKNNSETQSINKFKECFGGTIVNEYNSLLPVSFKGLAYILYKKLKG
jgi:hypothetical protein